VRVANAPGVLEGMPKGAWPRRERDVAAALRGLHARQGHGGGRGEAQYGGAARLGHGSASRCGCARTCAGPGFPGPRCGHAVGGALASRARGTTRGRRATAVVVSTSGAMGPCTRAAQWPDGEREFLRLGYRRFIGGARHHAGSTGETGAAATLTGGLAGEVLAGRSGSCRACGYTGIVVRAQASEGALAR
jgi:hypothetical protein